MKTVALLFFPLITISQPEMNKAIIQYSDSVMGKKIGPGRCGDFVAEALYVAGGKWSCRNNTYGKEIKNEKNILPGDIVLWQNVECADGFIKSHVAIIYTVLSPGRYLIVQQNNDGEKFVSKGDLLITEKCWNGKLSFFRPEK